MIAAGELIARIQSLIDDESSETKTDIKRHLNAAYREIAALHNWRALTVQVTLDSLVLPGDLVRPVLVQDDTDYIYFNIKGLPNRYHSSRLYNWFLNIGIATPLLTGTDMAVTAGSTSVTSATGGFTTADHDGEFIRIDENAGIYEIDSVSDTNTLVLKHAYRGASDTSQYFEIRPEGTQQLILSDQDGDAISTSTAVMWYLKKPLPLYNDYDQILLPGECEAVRIRTFQMMLESDKYDVDSQRQDDDYEVALSHMKSLDPRQSRPRAPRDRHGNRVMYGRRKTAYPRVDNSGNIYLG